MKRKKMAILLAVTLMFSGIGSTALTVNAADFVADDESVSETEAEADVETESDTEEENENFSIETEMETSDDGDEIEIPEISEEKADNEESMDQQDLLFEDDSEEYQAAGANDTSASALSLNVNTLYKDKLTGYSDVNWYKVKVTKAGNLSLLFKHDYIESSSDYWKATIYDVGMNELESNSFTGKIPSVTTAKVGIPVGEYYIKVEHDDGYSDTSYNFKILYNESSVWESEVNDTPNMADGITVNTTYYGGIQSWNDADWYYFDVKKSGYLSVTFNHDYIESSSSYWGLTIYNEEMEELTDYSYEGNNISKKSEYFGVHAERYYIKINRKYGHSDTAYNFKVNFSESAVWETEVNDTYQRADSIGMNTAYEGSIQRWNDVDWYKINITQTSDIILAFTHVYIDSSSMYWKLTILDSRNMKETGSYRYEGNKSSRTDKFRIAAGTYYIKIEHDDGYSDKAYKFRFSKYIPPVNISKAQISVGSAIYTGGNVRPAVVVKYGNAVLKNGVNYTVSYSNASKAGKTVTIRITGRGNYTGTIVRYAKISRKSIRSLRIKGVPSSRKYTGKSIRPKIKVYDGNRRLKANRDYTVSYGKNKKKGKGTITIKGKGNYSGKIKKYFKIRK